MDTGGKEQAGGTPDAGGKILWQGKSRAKWLGKIRKNWKGILFLLFFATAFGRGFYVVATAPARGEGSIPVLAVAGICCLMALLTILVILMGAPFRKHAVSRPLSMP